MNVLILRKVMVPVLTNTQDLDPSSQEEWDRCSLPLRLLDAFLTPNLGAFPDRIAETWNQ